MTDAVSRNGAEYKILSKMFLTKTHNLTLMRKYQIKPNDEHSMMSLTKKVKTLMDKKRLGSSSKQEALSLNGMCNPKFDPGHD